MIARVLTIVYPSVLVREGTLASLGDRWCEGSAFSSGWRPRCQTAEAIEGEILAALRSGQPEAGQARLS